MKTNLRTINTPMATASLVCGVAAVVTAFTCLLPFALCLGALAVIFAMLSKTEAVFLEHAKIGFICGIVALAINLLLILVISGFLIFSLTFRGTVKDTFNEFAREFSRELRNSGYYDDYYDDDYDDYDSDDDYEEYLPYNSWNDFFYNDYPSVYHGHNKT